MSSLWVVMILLGVQWLKTLDPINWDFTKMSLSFEVKKKQVILQGLDSKGIEVQHAMNYLKSSLVKRQDWSLQMVEVDQKRVESPQDGVIKLIKELHEVLLS